MHVKFGEGGLCNLGNLFQQMPIGPVNIPEYSGDIGADVLVSAVKTQHLTELRQDRESDEDPPRSREIREVPQGRRQLQGSKVSAECWAFNI